MIQILIVDDEKPICDLIQMSLTRAGYRCTCVYDGLAAADILERNVFDLILLDVMMPVMNGLEAARYIRWSNKENARDIPIIAMTANAFTEDRRRVLEAGMNEHLAKPLESEVLIEMIANYCGK